MRGAPIPPREYRDEDGPILDDAALKADGWAFGLGVWEQIGKAYEWYFSQGGDHPDGLDNAQMWSLQQAIRAQAVREFAQWIYEHGGEDGHGGEEVRYEVERFLEHEATSRG